VCVCLCTGMTVSCFPSSLPPFVGESKKRLYAQQRSRDVWTRTFPWTHTDEFVSAHCCACNVYAFADESVSVDNEDASANARRHVRERVCKLILSVCGGRKRYFALSCDSCKSLCLQLPTPPMVRLDTDHLQTPADANSIAGESENVYVRTSLPCSGRHQSRLCRRGRAVPRN